MNTEDLAKRAYELATKLWFRLVDTPGGHPGVAGPAGPGGPPWTLTDGYLEGAITALEQVLTQWYVTQWYVTEMARDRDGP